MNNIIDSYNQAELALAAYATLMPGIPSVDELKRDTVGMSNTEAQHFSENWLVVAQHTDSATGLSATLFQARDAQGNPVGQKYLAIRGTEPTLTDIGADGLLAVGISSKLNPQFTALKAQIDTWREVGGPLNGQTFTVTGHSLGGYLAAAVKEQYPAEVTQAYLYNAPGFGGIFGELLNGIGVINAGNGSGISNLVGNEGISVISGLGIPAAPPISILIEPAGGIGTGNHSIVTLTDSLAIYALYDKLAPGLDIATLSGLLDANTNDKSLTLETSLDTLRELLTGSASNSVAPTPTMADATTRDQFYTNLYDLQNNTNFQALVGTTSIVPLDGVKDVEMVAVAQSGGAAAIAYRYALVKGNAFAVVGSDTIYAQHNTSGELNLYDAATGTGELTETYLKARAAFVERKLYYGEHDIPYTYTTSIPVGTTDPYIAENILWQDRTGDISIEHPGATANTRRVIFGSDLGEADITGSNAADTLFGGKGDDTLTGGKGNDYLEGGQGADTYAWNTGDGFDAIRDTDGLGSIKMNGQTLTAGETKDGGHTYTSKDAAGNSHTYTVLAGDVNAAGGATLLIDGTIEVFNYRAGNLNLTLGDAAPVPVVQPTNTILGDILPTDIDPAKAGIQAAADANGNPVGTPGAYADILGGTAGNDHIMSGELGDDVGSDAGDDWIEGGTGNDYLHGGIGNDLIEGGQGSDILAGEDGNDRLFANTQIATDQAILNGNTDIATNLKGDWLSGGAGDDTLVAGADNDVLAGGGGNDLLIAGAGDDYILGDADYTAQYIWGADPSYSIGSTNWYHSAPATFDWTVTTDASGNATFAPVTGATDPADSGNDIIYAGDGNDRVWAGMGNDVVYGEAGADKISGEAGNDILFGGTGNDVLHGGENDDYLDGGTDNDTLWGGNGNDILVGGTGDDKLYGEAGANYLDGGDGADILNSGGPGSSLYGGAGNDDISAAGGGNMLDGGAGDDILVVDGDDNYLDGGDGINTVQAVGNNNSLFAGTGNDDLAAWGDGNYLDAGDGANTLYAQGTGNELFAGTGNDTLQATGGNNYLDAGDGNNLLVADMGGNTLISGSGNDNLQAGGGYNTLIGGAGDDTLIAYGGGNMLDGGDGRDLYVFDAGFGVNHIADSGTGGNTLQFNFSFAGSGIVVGLGSLKLSFATGDELHIDNFDPNDPANTCSIDTFVFDDQTLSLQNILDIGGPAVNFTIGPDIIGTAGADTLLGTDKAEHIYGLGGNDVIDAGARNDYIEGGAGNDIIDGGTGADVMKGGAGDDTYVVDNTGDIVSENLNEGWDTIQSSITYTLGNHVEDLFLAGTDNINGTGNALGNYLSGNDGNNILSGMAGADWLDGGAGDDTLSGGTGDDTLDGGTGADSMAGGTGNDVYMVDDSGDFITENLNEGTELVYSSATYTLGANLETLSLTGADNINGTGNELNNRIDGNSSDNILKGGGGNDTFFGGAGENTLMGGTGDDTYFVQGQGDTVSENANEGIDLVYSTIDYTLAANVENLTLTGMGNTAIGNALDNIITGNANANRLSGAGGNDSLYGLDGSDTLDGGTGIDMMTGGGGNDTYVVDNAGDRIFEGTNGGVDTVQSSITFTLGYETENLILTGTANINGTGNIASNIIIGNSGNNTLTDPSWGDDIIDGGAGADIMSGGYYNDTYYVDNVGDQVVETYAGLFIGGNDIVYSSVTFTLGANVENLTLTGLTNINGIGNSLANEITGNGGINLLSGGAGDDIYHVHNTGDTVIEAANKGYDRVYSDVDFTLSGNTEFLSLNDGALVGIGDDSNNDIEGNRADNLLEGRAGDDYLNGHAGNDMLFGGDGNDSIHGGYDAYYEDDNGWGLLRNSDVLDGGAGDDNIDGGSGNDTIIGGIGNDTLFGGDDDGGEGADPLSNNDVIDGGEGDDSIDGGSGSDILHGGIGDDYLYGGGDSRKRYFFDYATQSYLSASSDDILNGEEGNDVLDGGSGADRLLGGDGDDTLYGGDNWDSYMYDPVTDTYTEMSNDDYLDGGAGLDALIGGQGDDIYVVDGDYVRSADVPVVNDCGDPALAEQLVWTTDTVTEYAEGGYDIVMSSASYTLADNVEELRLTFDPAMATSDPQRHADLLNFGQDGVGNALDNVLVGNELNNRLAGELGNDTLEGGDGNDTLIGGQGDDTLSGGAGNDRYVFRLGDGADVIEDSQGIDTLYIGNELTAADIAMQRVRDDLVVSINNSMDSITLTNWFTQTDGVKRIEFCDGSTLDNLFHQASNTAPIAVSDLVAIGEDDVQAVIAAANLLSNDIDQDAGDTFSLVGFDAATAQGNTVSQDANGDLVVDVGSRYQSLGAGQTASDSFGYTIADAASMMSSATVHVSITGSNDAPVLALPVADQATQQDASFSFAVPAGSFTDIDNGDVLSYSAMLADGSALPGWLSFDAATQTFSGTPGNGDVGNLSVLVTVTDTGGLSASSAFAVNVVNVNDAPIATADAITTNEDAAGTTISAAELLANDYDIDMGDVFTLTGFDAVSANGNAIAQDAAGNLVLDIGNRYQSLAAGETATDSFSYTIIDMAGATSTATVTVTIDGVNDAPVTQDDFAGMSQDAVQPVSGNVLANDSDVDQGTVLTLANAGVIAGNYGSLTLNADGSYSYTLDNARVQALGAGQHVTESFAYEATDGIVVTPATLTVTIAGVNDAPVSALPVADQATQQDASFSFAVPAGTFADIDIGDVLTYGATLADGSPLPDWLAFDAATHIFSGTSGNSDVGSLSVLVTATDTGGLSASSAFSLDVANVNDTPTANADTGAAVEDGGTVLLDAATLLANDTDPDFIHGDALNIVGVSQADSGAGVSLVNGSVQYDPSTSSGQANGTLFQSLGQGQAATDTFSYTVSDMAGATSTATVTITIAGVNDAPVTTADDAAALQEDLSITATSNVLINDSDVDQGTVLSVANAGVFAGQYGMLTLNADGGYAYALDNASPGVQSLAEGQVVTDTFAYQATDGIAATPSTLTLTVTGLNDAPVAVADTASVQEDLNITATGNVLANDSDIDQGTVLSVVDAGTYQGSYGSLSLATDGSYSYALDNASLAVQSLGRDAQVVDHFGFTVTDGMAGTSSLLDVFLNGLNDAPILVAPLADQNFTFDKHFSWQVPGGSFTDIDHGDTLDYAATLADGSALPEWLSFDAATQTFSGETPKQVGSVDVRVTATDKVAATGSTAGSLSASDVFRISVSHDHDHNDDHNHNDGAGALPCHPVSKDGMGHSGDYASHSHGNESSDHSSAAGTHKRDAKSKHTGDSDSHDTEALIRSWFDQQSASEQHLPFGTQNRKGAWESQIDRQVNRSVSNGISGSVSKEWERMNARLKNHLEQSGNCDSLLAESGTGFKSFGLFGSQSHSSASHLGMGNGHQMKEFTGLKEGLERLGC